MTHFLVESVESVEALVPDVDHWDHGPSQYLFILYLPIVPVKAYRIM